MRIRKKSLRIVMVTALILCVLFLISSFVSTISKTWQDSSSWKLSGNFILPSYNEKQIKISQQQTNGTNVTVKVDYCLLLPTERNETTLKLKCSLLPRALGLANLYDPYRWVPPNGIEISLDKAQYPSQVEFLTIERATFEQVNVSGLPIPVSLVFTYEKDERKSTLVNKISHWMATRSGEAETITTTITSVKVSRLKEFSELTTIEKRNFLQDWYRTSLVDLEEVLKFSLLEKLEGQDLLDEYVKTARSERYMCNTENGKVNCRLSSEGNPGEFAMYYTYVNNTKIGAKMKTEMRKRLYPFSPRDSKDVLTCDTFAPNNTCDSWSEIALYQFPACPINELDNPDETVVKHYLEYAKNVSTKADIKELPSLLQAYYQVGSQVDYIEGVNLRSAVDSLCKSALASQIKLNDADFRVLRQAYSELAFRGVTYWKNDSTPKSVSLNNLEEALYYSYTFNPYTFHFVQDGSVLLTANIAGYSQDRLESTLGHAYNLFASIVAVYLLQSGYASK